MCTVTFIPQDSNGYILTSNRDEITTRPPATPPFIQEKTDYQLIYPRDPHGGGSWIASDNRNNAVCLLNGAFRRHKPQYPYRHSRGLVVLDFFDFNNLFDFIDFYDLHNIEPFTLVIVHDFRLFEFRWDGNQRYLKNLNFSKPAIWSSVTLYGEEVVRKREVWFQKWLKKDAPFTLERILDFHMFAGEGNKKTDVLMKRDDLIRTISITSLFNQDKHATMYYKDILNHEDHQLAIHSN
jgi:hypothetical protein